MQSRPMKIGVFGNFGIGNFGNEATFAAMLDTLKRFRPDAELTCICTNPDQVRQDYGLQAVPLNTAGRSPLMRKLSNIWYAIEVVRKLDVLIIPGTGILNDYCAPPFGLPYTLFRWCLAARLCGTRLALVSIGAGPLHHGLTKWFVLRSAAMATYRSYRNLFSKNYLAGLGFDVSNDPVYPDLAFALPIPSAPPQAAPAQRLTVCIGAMHYQGWRGHLETDENIYETYLGKLRDFALWLLERGMRVHLVMGDERDWRAVCDLRQAISTVRPSLPDDLVVVERAGGWQDAFRQLRAADIVVATRFHTLVFALMLGKPTISVGYSEYHTELIETMGLGGFAQHSESIDLEVLISQFSELSSNRAKYEPVIVQRAETARSMLADQEQKVMHRLFGQSSQPLGATKDVAVS
ncbi:polysaccharide pyruvyl transferase WcaK-like protein [Bradyrhizobium sp. USDA 4369]